MPKSLSTISFQKSNMLKKDPLLSFEKISKQWLFDLEHYTNEVLYQKPSETQWCLAELFDHIIRVARTYQLPNFNNCIQNNIRKGALKNGTAYLVFDLNIIPYKKIRMESFPTKVARDFNPLERDANELIEDFKLFINEVKRNAALLSNFDKKTKHFHPFFGMINAKEWFSLVEIHMRHHSKQKKRLESLKLS
ncbi:hypothetical protein D1816_11220 [Aquimarina sp. AD10]|uniref:DinB family protein n=1 Tax=Aquimarina sp. AD10 TaxID=1714849 RepID=UPI000E487DD9|nr:DinB family protein [Aquimarina sp. AD10]AXT60892.1 hypothetical protein D1816_11220 [Aquimarina sp. AD10]RKM93031.1 hypothetical protein D7033_20225 [Aquimarina sp. AD10]